MIMKTIDENILSDIVSDDDAELLFTVLANTNYAFKFHIFYDTPAAADFKYNLANNGATITLVRIRKKSINPGTSAYVITAAQTVFGTSTSIATASATPGEIEISGIVQVGASGGIISFQWSQNTSTASATTVRAGSFLEFSK